MSYQRWPPTKELAVSKRRPSSARWRRSGERVRDDAGVVLQLLVAYGKLFTFKSVHDELLYNSRVLAR